MPSLAFLDGSRRYKHLTTPERREAFSSLLSGDFYRLNIFSVALHLSLEFGIYNATLDLDTTVLSELCAVSIFIFKSAAVFVLFTN